MKRKSDMKAEVRTNLAKIIRATFQADTESSEREAKRLLGEFILPLGENNHWNPDRHNESFDKVLKLTRDLCAEWKSMSFFARSQIRNLNRDHRFRGVSSGSSTSPRQMMEFLTHGAEILDGIKDDAREVLADGVKPGRRDYRAIRVVASCRRVWHAHTGIMPMSENHAPFMGFVSEVFVAFEPLGLRTKPQSAVEAWRTHGELTRD